MIHGAHISNKKKQFSLLLQRWSQIKKNYNNETRKNPANALHIYICSRWGREEWKENNNNKNSNESSQFKFETKSGNIYFVYWEKAYTQWKPQINNFALARFWSYRCRCCRLGIQIEHSKCQHDQILYKQAQWERKILCLYLYLWMSCM